MSMLTLVPVHNSITKSSLISLAYTTWTDLPVKKRSRRIIMNWVADAIFFFIYVCSSRKFTEIFNQSPHYHESDEFLNKWPYEKALNLVCIHLSRFILPPLASFSRYSVDIKNQCPAKSHTYIHTQGERQNPEKNTTGKCFRECERSELNTSRKRSVYFGNTKKYLYVCAISTSLSLH